MNTLARFGAVMAIGSAATTAWLVLGGVTHSRATDSASRLEGAVAGLWGRAQRQRAPVFTFTAPDAADVSQPPDATTVRARVDADPRRRGLVWYPLYNVAFDGRWTYVHHAKSTGRLLVDFALPDVQGIYDDFVFTVNGEDRTDALRTDTGTIELAVPVSKGDRIEVHAGYRTRGSERWTFGAADGTAALRNYDVEIRTSYADVDFAQGTMSPTAKERAGEGWKLRWHFSHLVTGADVAVVVPEPLQPGALAARLAWSAPVSLLFFFGVLFVIGLLRKIDIHPVNYLFLAAAFFAFHLLFAYLVDHVPVLPAFATASAASLVLVVTYLRLVVSSRFAFREAALAQLVYLVGFSLAHFWEGFTGLTITIMAVLTLFLLMQLTGRIRWTEVLARRPAAERARAGAPAPAPLGAALDGRAP